MNFHQIIFASILCASAASADVYRWVDENGVVHYSDKAPASTQPDKLELAPESDTPPANIGAGVYDDAIENTRAWREQHEAERQQTREAREEREKAELTSTENCSKAIHRLAILNKQCPVFYDGAGFLRDQCPGVYVVNAGERSYVDDDERARLIEHYSEIVKQCRAARDQTGR